MGADSLDKSICNGDGDSLSHEVGQDDSLAICAGVAEKRRFNAPRDPCRDFAIRHIIFVFLEGSDWHTSESIKIATTHPSVCSQGGVDSLQVWPAPVWCWSQSVWSFECGNIQCSNFTPERFKVALHNKCIASLQMFARGVFVSGQQLQQCEVDKIVELCGNSPIQKTGVTETQVWGVPWSEQQFIEQMVRFGHPMNLQSNLPEALRDTLEIYNSMDAQQRMAYRANKLGFWLKRLLELKNQENTLKQSLDPEVAQVLQTKNILLWKDMLKSNQYSDMEVVSEFMSGSMLVGCVERTGLWPAKFQPAAIGVEELHQVAIKERTLFQQQFGQGNQEQYLDEVWAKTLDEVKAGALVGPFDLSEIPDSYPLSRRFGILQGSKLRCIDDYSRSSVNSSVQTCESPKPHTLDVYAALCVLVMSSCGHPNSKWLGRTFDLTGAYRQCAVHHESRPYAHIAVRHPSTGDIKAFRMLALPFGAVRSVHSFLRISASLWFLLVKEFLVLATNYFDDFVTLAEDIEAPAVTACVHMFFKLVGWAFAAEGPKAPEFAELFTALGVTINVGRLHEGLVTLGNTESRREELLKCLSNVLASKKLTKAEALRLRGRLQFAAGNVFGRVAKSALAAVSAHAYDGGSSTLNSQTFLALALHKKFLEIGRPRELRPTCNVSWYIQTDACYDPDDTQIFAGVGGVLFTPEGKPVQFFSQRLSEQMIADLNPGSRKTAIFECEFLALFCAMLIWGSSVSSAVVVYTDNNAVRDAMISCHTTNTVAKKILIATLSLESELQLAPWYARVPTDSNTADNPSRLTTSPLLKMGAKQCEVCVEERWGVLVTRAESWGEQQVTRAPQCKRVLWSWAASSSCQVRFFALQFQFHSCRFVCYCSLASVCKTDKIAVMKWERVIRCCKIRMRISWLA